MPPVAHSELGASGASRWLACPGSVRMSRLAEEVSKNVKNVSRKSNFAADEGTLAHEVCEALIKYGPYKVDEMFGHEYCIGDSDIVVDNEMVNAAEMYVDVINSMVHPSCKSVVEKRFSLDWLYEGMFGTCDCCVMDDKRKTLYIFDFKYGKRHAVSAHDNPQLKYYALGVLGPVPGSIEKVVMTIVQPRNTTYGACDTFEMSTPDLYKWAYTELLPAAKLAMTDDAPLNPGNEQCRWCKGAKVCSALYDNSMNLVKEFFPTIEVERNEVDEKLSSIVLPPSQELTAAQISNVLAIKSIMSDYFDVVEQEAIDRMANGVDIPGFKLVRGRSRRVWYDNEEAEEMLRAHLGDACYKKTLFSPAQAEKLIDKRIVADYTEIEEGKLTVAKTSDKRKPVNLISD